MWERGRGRLWIKNETFPYLTSSIKIPYHSITSFELTKITPDEIVHGTMK